MAIKTTEGHITLQHHIAQILCGPQRDRVMSQFQEPREIAWPESLQDNTAGLWLDCAPKSEMHKIANDEFRVALTLRLFLHQKYHSWYDVRLCRKGKSAIPLDCNGIHLTTGCIKGGNSIHNHDQDSVLLWSEHQGLGAERIQSVRRR